MAEDMRRKTNELSSTVENTNLPVEGFDYSLLDSFSLVKSNSILPRT